ncbi:MAG: glycosyltransferase [Methylotenera sp.]|nr:glycosyltransferase [Methylotenera sp.]
MRVCLLYPHLFGHDGYVRDINRLYTELTQHTHHQITTCPPSQDPAIQGRLGFDELALIKPLRAALREVDVVHVFGFFFPLYPLLMQIIRMSGKPYILSPLGQLESRALTVSGKKKSFFINTVGKWMLSNAVIVHAFSESEVKSIRAITPNAPIMEAPLGIYYEDIPSEINTSKLRPKGEYFLFFGRLGYFHKGIDVLLDGYAHYLANGGASALVIAGKSWQGSHELIHQRIQELNISGMVHFLGEVSMEEKFSLIKECKAFVYPTRYDGPPRPIREALALKKPLLISHQANINSNMENRGWGYAFNPNPEELSVAMRRMDAEYVADNYQDPEDWLSWEIIAKQYSEIYDRT